MNEVQIISHPTIGDIEILQANGKIGYTFSYDGNAYGNSVKLKTRKTGEVFATALVLLINAEETYRELNKGKGTKTDADLIREKLRSAIFPSKEDDGVEHVDMPYKVFLRTIDMLVKLANK